MSKRDRIKIDKNEEMRTKGISKMISEGGLGAEKYYDVIKESREKEKEASKYTSNNEEENEGK